MTTHQTTVEKKRHTCFRLRTWHRSQTLRVPGRAGWLLRRI